MTVDDTILPCEDHEDVMQDHSAVSTALSSQLFRRGRDVGQSGRRGVSHEIVGI